MAAIPYNMTGQLEPCQILYRPEIVASTLRVLAVRSRSERTTYAPRPTSIRRAQRRAACERASSGLEESDPLRSLQPGRYRRRNGRHHLGAGDGGTRRQIGAD